MTHRKIIVLSVDYDPDLQDDPAIWDWESLTNQPNTVVITSGFFGARDGDSFIDENGVRFTADLTT